MANWKNRFQRPKDTSNDVFAYLNRKTGMAYHSNEFYIRKCRGEDLDDFELIRNKDVTPALTKQVLEALKASIEKTAQKMSGQSPSTDPEPTHTPSTLSPSPEV